MRKFFSDKFRILKFLHMVQFATYGALMTINVEKTFFDHTRSIDAFYYTSILLMILMLKELQLLRYEEILRNDS